MLAAAIALTSVLILVFALASVRRVPEGSVFTVHRFGRYARTLAPGWHCVIPFADRIAHRVHLLGHHVQLPTGPDHPAGAVYYQILEPQRAGQALDDVDNLVRREARERLSQLAADVAEPAALAKRLKDELNRQLGRIGLLVIRCQLNLPTAH